MDTFKRKVPAGIRPIPGHVPSTVFNKESSQNGSSDQAAYYCEELRSQKRAETELRNKEKKKDLEMLHNYNPWGKPGGGAPRQSGQVQMMKLEKSLNDSDQAAGSLVELLNRPGGGAPLRTESGNPIGVIYVHPDIRNNRDQLNEENKKRTKDLEKLQPVPNGDARFHKAQVLGGRQKTSEELKSNLKERLDKQIDEKRVSLENTDSVMESSDWMDGKVGYIQRDNSGKILRLEPLTQRGVDGLREYCSGGADKSIVEQFGKPGPGVARRTDSGNVHSQLRGVSTDRDDPFRPGHTKSPANQVFPVGIEHEAKERAWKRHPDLTPRANQHTIENGYYIDPNEQPKVVILPDTHTEPTKPIGTVYSALLRTKGNYLDDLKQQISEKQVSRQKQKVQSLDQDFQHIRSSDIFGRPGNGAPRLMGGEIRTARCNLDELATQCEGQRNPGAFRGLH